MPPVLGYRSRMYPAVPVVAIVDDEPGFRRALSRLLEQSGFVVRSFASGRKLLARIDGIDCVILDLNLSEMSGFDVQRALVARGASVPVVMLTSDDTPINRARSLTEGACAFLTKPVEDEELLHVLKALAPARRSCAN